MGEKIVMAAGVFDILHLGHLNYLQEAKKLGDRLVVVVACDETVRNSKHEPLMNEDMRYKMVGSLKPVDTVVMGSPGDKFTVVEEIKPDVIALGYDQRHREEDLKEELIKRGLDNIRVLRLDHYNHDLDGTRKIIRKIIDWYGMKKELEAVEGR